MTSGINVIAVRRFDSFGPHFKMAESKLDSKVSAFGRRQSEHVHYQPIGVRARARQAAMARRHNGLKPMRFVSLHHHSTYSFLDGFQLPEAHVRRAAEINMGAVAMTEHGNIFSHVKLEKAAEEQGVKPIFGCEVYLGWTDDKRKSQRKNHLTVIAKNEEGYQNLLKLVTKSWREGFHYEPTVNPRWLVKYRKGLIILSGCQSSALFTALVGGKLVKEEEASYERALEVARWFAKRFDDYFIEVQAFPELDKTRDANPMLARIAKHLGLRLVATMDCHYTAPEESEIQQILHSVRPGEKRTVEEMVRDWGYKVPLCPPPTDRAVYKRLIATGLTREQAIQAIVSTEEIAQECSVTLPKLPRIRYPLPAGVNSPKALWRRWLKRGWRYRGCDDLPPKERSKYRRQLQHEIELIEAKDYVGYFLVVADAVTWAKEHQIPVGPARGSAAGSLACWLLRITEVNPMLYPDLIFERFIDWTREDMPDIDLDFATYGIPQVREYMEKKYGSDCVNSVGTFTMYKPKLSMDDAARVHRVPAFEVKKVKELLLERSSGDLRASASIEDTIDQFEEAREIVDRYPGLKHAMDLEGNAKGFGIHAAGLVISNGPITEVCSVLEKEVKGERRQVVSMDKYDAERQGLEKLDFLSLSTMDMIAEILRQIDRPLEDLYDIPLDDPETIKGFQENDVVGVFQFDGRATRIVNGALKPDNFDEVALVNALSRPGPLHNGAAQGYIKNKWAKPEDREGKLHPALDRITANTLQQIVFQEQILRITGEIGGFDHTHRAKIRRIISRKKGDQEFNREKERFIAGALKVHERHEGIPPMDRETAAKIWGMCITAGSYAFNAAHSYSYGKLAFWCMFLKRNAWGNGPAPFYASALSRLPSGAGSGSASERGGSASGAKTDRHAALRRDAVKRGISILPPDAVATASWRAVGDKTLVAGWEQIPGIGAKMANKIADFVSANPGANLIEIPGVGPKTVETIQSFQEKDDPFDLLAVERALKKVRRAIKRKRLGDDVPEPSHSAIQALEAAGGRIVFLGIPFHRNLRDLFEANRARTGEALDPNTVSRPDLSEWMMMLCRDEEEIISLCFPRKKYPRFKDALWKLRLNQDVILIRGRKASAHMKGSLTVGQNRTGLIYVDDLWVIEP